MAGAQGGSVNPAVLWAVIGDGLRVVETLLEHGTPEALKHARDVVAALIEGHSGKLLPEDVAQQLEDMRSELAANDAAADQALRDKFRR